MACCAALQQRPGWAAPRASLPPTAAGTATARRLTAGAWRPRHQPAVAAQAARQQQPGSSGSYDSAAASEVAVAAAAAELRAHLQQAADGSSNAEQRLLDNMSATLRAAETDPAAIAAARQRLQAYLQQQRGISQAEAARLAGKLSAALGAAADQQAPAAMQWFVGRGMQPFKAARLLVHICSPAARHASDIRQWPTWQPVYEANWHLADSYLAVYQQQCRDAKQRPLKASESMAVMLSSMPSRYRLLRVPDIPSRLALLQQQLGLTDAEAGQLVAAGLDLAGSLKTTAASLQWLVAFAGSRQAALSMLRAAPTLLKLTPATLDSKVAALQAAWAGALQPQQVRQLVQRSAQMLGLEESRYQPAADVLRSWFPQFNQLLAAATEAPQLLGASADILQANERWFTGPPLSLSRQQFLARVRAAPQAFAMNLADDLTQHKLAFLTQVGGVPLERALSGSHLNYLKSGVTALAGRYFLLTEHGVPLPRHKDGGIGLSYAIKGRHALLRLLRLLRLAKLRSTHGGIKV